VHIAVLPWPNASPHQHKRLKQDDWVLPTVTTLVNLAMVAAHEQGILGQVKRSRYLT
jgi:hypothetical protein